MVERMRPFTDRISFDGMGSVIAVQGTQGPRIMLDAHMDELGGMIRRITPDGYLSMQMLGGWLDQALVDQRWTIITAKGSVQAITGIRDVHLVPPDERTRVYPRDSILLDVGAKNAAEVRAMGIQIGDPVAPDAPVALDVRGVTVRFGGVLAVDDVTFAARTGEVLGVMGPNGAGKTTLFNVISGVQRPTAGEVALSGARLSGRDVEDVAALGVTRTFQTPVMFWGLTVRESIEVALSARALATTYPPSPVRELLACGMGLPGRRREAAAVRDRADAILTRAGIAAMADRATESLAFGEERLLELARALAAAPTVLLLDEPLSGLNPDEVEAVLASIRAARADGVAVLLVEHAVGELLAVADRVVVLDHGRKIAEGTPQAVAADPIVIDAYIGDELE